MESFISPLLATRLAAALVALLAVLGAPTRAGAQPPVEPPELRIEQVEDGAVTLSWNSPAEFSPEAYVVEGGFAPSDTAGSLTFGPDTTSVTVPLGRGEYFIRAYAVVDGRRSAPSNEVQVTVGLRLPPSTPDAFAAVAVGSSVVLTWRSTFAGGDTDRVSIEVAGPVSGSLVLGNTGSFRVGAVPPGEYTLRLRGVNDAGESAPTAPLTVRLPGLVPVVRSNPAGGPAAARLPVRFERLDLPRLDQLRTREQLDAVVDGAASEFEVMVRLRDWTAAQFPHTVPVWLPPWDALIVLDAIRAGITGGYCGHYSQVLLQSLASLGITARYVEIGPTDLPYNHFLVEAWSSDFEKWVVLDPTFVVHYERDGVPLSALEIHDALVGGDVDAVTVVQGPDTAGHPSVHDFPEQTKALFYYVRYQMKADHLSRPDEVAFDRYNDMIEFRDIRTVPWEDSTVPSEYPKEVLTARTVDDRAEIDAPINQVWLTASTGGPGEVVIGLQTTMPHPAAAEFRVIGADGSLGPWQRHFSPVLVWSVGPGDRVVEIRIVNPRGVTGPSAFVELTTP